MNTNVLLWKKHTNIIILIIRGQKKPTIFRETKQWFTFVEGFRQAVLDAIKNVKWVPPQAEN